MLKMYIFNGFVCLFKQSYDKILLMYNNHTGFFGKYINMKDIDLM